MWRSEIEVFGKLKGGIAFHYGEWGVGKDNLEKINKAMLTKSLCISLSESA